MKERIILIGPPASGKGTQTELISARYQIPVMSPGAILRDERARNTKLGRRAEDATNRGELVDDEILLEIVHEWLVERSSRFIFDGNPRSMAQAVALEDLLEQRRIVLDLVLSFEADVETIRSRVGRRMVCNKCAGSFSIGTHVCSERSVCLQCSGALIRRNDDTIEAVEHRLREFVDKTLPVIAHFNARGLLRSVDAAREPEVMFESITAILEER